MSVQMIYQKYLKNLSNRERMELIRLLAEEASKLGTEAAATPEEKLQLSNRLRAEATQQQWTELSEQLPDVPDITMEEIIAEVKEVRKMRHNWQDQDTNSERL